MSSSIKDIILHYLNPHELYIEELKDKTKDICTSMKHGTFRRPFIDYGYSETHVVRVNFYWKMGTGLFNYPKNDRIKELNKRVNERNKILGIIETNKYGMKNSLCLATNFCYINY